MNLNQSRQFKVCMNKWYKKEILLDKAVGNNLFSYEERKSLHQRDPFITIPKVIEGTIDDVCVGQVISFEEVEEGELKSCYGLENFVHIQKSHQDIFIFDNHNHAFYFWAEARSRGVIHDGATLIHIDQHKDMRDPGVYLPACDLDDLEKVAVYTNEVLNVGNFILPAQKSGMLGEIFLLDAEDHFRQDFSAVSENLIVDIDLDIFAPELDFMDQEMILQETRRWVAKAKVVTVATSPFFIDQGEAMRWMRRIFLPLEGSA